MGMMDLLYRTYEYAYEAEDAQLMENYLMSQTTATAPILLWLNERGEFADAGYIPDKEKQKMTGKQKSAGYFDSVRNCPMYVGDVYYNKKEELPYYKIIDNISMGISVHHNGTTEVTPIARFGANLVQMDFIGNSFENENVIEEHKASLETPQEPVIFANTPISDATENISEEVEMVEETQQTERLPQPKIK